MDVEKLRNLLGRAPRGGEPVLCIEINPPRGVDVDSTVEKLRGRLAGIDLLNITDCALARMKLAGLPFGAILKRELGLEPLVNLSCRDRNVIALQADLLAAWAMGVRSVVALTGDAVTVGDAPDTKGVFEINSVGLLKLISKLNSGVDQVGNALKGAPQFVLGGVVNPNARNPAAEVKRLLRKKEAGVEYVLSQPVFDTNAAREFLELAQPVGVPIFLGLMVGKTPPIARGFAKIPGIRIGGEIEQLLNRPDGDDISAEFIDHCIKLAQAVRGLVAGYHVISGASSALALNLAGELVRAVKHG